MALKGEESRSGEEKEGTGKEGIIPFELVRELERRKPKFCF